MFSHDKPDITMVSYVLQAAEAGRKVIQGLSDNTDVFVLLVYVLASGNLNIQLEMEKLGWSRPRYNGTCEDLGIRKCRQLLGMQMMSGSNTTSFPYSREKITALNKNPTIRGL